MKQVNLLITLIFFQPLFSFGQTVVLSTDQTRVLYARMENLVSLSVPGYPCEDLRIRAANCSIKNIGCSYTVTPDSVNAIVFIIRSKKYNKVIDTVTVPVRYVPNSVFVRITHRKDNTGPILKDGPIVVGEDGSFLEGLFHITGFIVTMVRDAKVIYEHKTIGSHFDGETVAVIENARPGDRFFMEEISVIGPDNKRRIFNPIAYMFK